MTGILSLLAAAVGVFLTGRLSGIKYLHAGGGALVTAALAMLFGAPLWATIACSVIVAVTVYVAIWRRASGMRTMPALVSGGALLTAIALVAGIVGFMGMSSPTAQAGATPSNSWIVKELTVNTVPREAECTTDANGVIPWDVPAINLTAPGRLWPDSIEPPFTTNDPYKVRAEVLKTNCVNPNFGVMDANALANLEVQGVKVGDVNSWLKPYEGTSNELIATKAAAFMPLLNVKTPTDAQLKAAPEKNREYQEFIAKVNTLLLRFFIDGVRSGPSTLNYHLLVGGLTAGLPMIVTNPDQEGLPALRLKIMFKGQDVCGTDVGFNMKDRRWEQFACTTPSTPGTPTPGTPTHPGTPGTPTPGCTSGCTTTPPTPTPSPSCKYYTSPQGTCYGPKTPAPQPSGVGKPTSSGPGTVSNTPPPPKPTPLKPSSGSGGGGSQPTAPGATPVPSYSPPPLNTGAPAPSQAPTSAPCAPGTC